MNDIKSRKKIKKKLSDAKHKYYQKKCREELSTCPKNCRYNYRHKDGQGNEIGLCMYNSDNPEEWKGFICDDVATAEQCPLFTLKKSDEDLLLELEEDLKDDQVVAAQYKDIAALQWVLGEKVYSWDLPWYHSIVLAIWWYIYRFSHYLNKMGLN